MTTVDNRNHTIHSSSTVGGVSIEVAPTDNKNRNATSSLGVNHEDEVEMEIEEEKAIVDEEIDSMEGEDFDDDEKMFQVALVNSVMDTAGGGTPSRKPQPPPQQPSTKVSSSSSSLAGEQMSPRSKSRYGLRKRRRPGVDHEGTDDFSNVPHDGSTSSSTLPAKPPLISHPAAIKTTQTQTQTQTQTLSIQQIKQQEQPQISSGGSINSTGGNAKTGIIISSKPPAAASTAATPMRQLKPSKIKIEQAVATATNNLLFASSSKKSSFLKKTKTQPQRNKRKGKSTKAIAATMTTRATTKVDAAPEILAGSSSAIQVPNPLLGRARSLAPAAPPSTTLVSCPPLVPAAPVHSPLDPIAPPIVQSTNKQVTMADPLVQSRTRVFSVDLDPSTFDFSDTTGGVGYTDNNNKANNESSQNAPADDLPIFQGRDRAFSFEVFNFASGGTDDLCLPNPTTSGVASSSSQQTITQGPPASLTQITGDAIAQQTLPPKRGRPRGDSIIFDPVSFQDGGIHEKNALEKARLKELIPPQHAQQQQQQVAPLLHPATLPHPATSQQLRSLLSAAPPPAVLVKGAMQQPTRISTFSSTSQHQATATATNNNGINSQAMLLQPRGGTATSHNQTPMVAGQNHLLHPVLSSNSSTTFATSQAHPTAGRGSSQHIVGTSASTTANPLLSSASSVSQQIATLPSSLSASNNAQNGPPTFQMELLNKDGRIGIYLPEARRLRIARFHAKRKMRIWRKRIKYDCRKKLADSRPRIKGRFVKRSDMD